MPAATGITYICDRCGKSHFVPTVDSRGTLSKFPKGWLIVEGKYICPVCAVPFKKFVAWFFDEGAIPEQWKENEKA